MTSLTIPSLTWQSLTPTSKTAWIGLAAGIAIVGPATALFLFKASVTRHASINSGKRTPGSKDSTPRLPVSLPPSVASPSSTHILCYERAVSRPIPSGTLVSNPVAALVRSSMTAFGRTPQAFVIRSAVKSDAEAYRSFDAEAIASKQCQVGDIFGGVYRVVYRGDGGVGGNDRVEMMIESPKGYKGPVVEGMIVAGVEKLELKNGTEMAVLINETWMWREEGGSPVLLESRVGRWLHELMVSWFAKRGVWAVTRRG